VNRRRLMKGSSDILLGIMVGVLVGMWLAQGPAHGLFWFADSFNEPSASEKMADELQQALRETRKSLGQIDY
jgi:hypothetical protein